MLTKIGVAALLGTIGTAAVGGTAKADEHWRTPVAPIAVTVAAPPVVVATPVDYRYGDRDGYDFGRGDGYGTPGVMYRRDRREDLERMRRERREQMMRHARWLHEHHGYGRGYGW